MTTGFYIVVHRLDPDWDIRFSISIPVQAFISGKDLFNLFSR